MSTETNYFDYVPQDVIEQLQGLYETAQSLGTFQPKQMLGDKSPDFYLGMVCATRGLLSIIHQVPTEQIMEHLERLSIDSCLLAYQKSREAEVPKTTQEQIEQEADRRYDSLHPVEEWEHKAFRNGAEFLYQLLQEQNLLNKT